MCYFQGARNYCQMLLSASITYQVNTKSRFMIDGSSQWLNKVKCSELHITIPHIFILENIIDKLNNHIFGHIFSSVLMVSTKDENRKGCKVVQW